MRRVQNVDTKQLKLNVRPQIPLSHRHSSLIVDTQQNRTLSYIGIRTGYAYRLQGQRKPDANEKLSYQIHTK